MIDLLPAEFEALRAVIRAGGDGLRLNDGIETAMALRLALDGLIRIKAVGDEPRWVIVTSKGAATARRGGQA